MNIAFFITPHGFGHAARGCAVMQALLRRRPDCRFEIFTRVPQWFFADSLPDCFAFHDTMCDVGLVQTSPLDADIDSTLERLESFLPFSQETILPLAKGVSERGCRAVVCDISPLGIAVARAAGLPSILIENFTWDWIYEAYADAYPRFCSIINVLAEHYMRPSVHIQSDPVCRPRAGAVHLFPISRTPRASADEVRAKLDIPEAAQVVLITMGGVGTRHRFAARLTARPDTYFVMPQDIPCPTREANLISLPQRSGFYHPDLVRAADVVVGKVGYSTLAEVCHAGKPFVFINREGFRESAALAAYAEVFAAGVKISAASFESGDWITALDRLPAKPPAMALPNAADQAADIILDRVYPVVTPSVPATRIASPPRFDPFSSRKARDVRNLLSVAFGDALKQNDPLRLQQTIDHLLRTTTEFIYRYYITDRRERFARVFDLVLRDRISDSLPRMIPIWNVGLYFECHEYLEPFWLAARGDQREALKGLIRAAGAYVHLETGNLAAAGKMAKKAIPLLRRHHCEPAFIDNMDALLDTLEKLTPRAPTLRRVPAPHMREKNESNGPQQQTVA